MAVIQDTRGVLFGERSLGAHLGERIPCCHTDLEARPTPRQLSGVVRCGHISGECSLYLFIFSIKKNVFPINIGYGLLLKIYVGCYYKQYMSTHWLK